MHDKSFKDTLVDGAEDREIKYISQNLAKNEVRELRPASEQVCGEAAHQL